MILKKMMTDYEMIEAFQDKNHQYAEVAFNSFHKKYMDFIYATCSLFIFSNPRIREKKVASDEFSWIILEKIYEKVNLFSLDKSIPPREQEVHLKKWIYKLINNTYIDYYTRKLDRSINASSFDDVNLDQVEFSSERKSDENNNTLTPEQKLKYEAILSAMSKANLSEMENDVLRVYLESGYWDDKENWNLPTERIDELTTKHGVKKNSIIKCKSRLINKIKSKI